MQRQSARAPATPSQLELPRDHGVAAAAEQDSVAFEPAIEEARSLAGLKRAELIPAELLRPIRRQRGMGRAGHRVLVDAEIGHEYPARDVLLVAARGDDRHARD